MCCNEILGVCKPESTYRCDETFRNENISQVITGKERRRFLSTGNMECPPTAEVPQLRHERFGKFVG